MSLSLKKFSFHSKFSIKSWHAFFHFPDMYKLWPMTIRECGNIEYIFVGMKYLISRFVKFENSYENHNK
jgi:hypothetical protein